LLNYYSLKIKIISNFVTLETSRRQPFKNTAMKSFYVLLIVFTSFQFTNAQDSGILPEVISHIKVRVDEGFNPSISAAYMEGDKVTYFNYGTTQFEIGKPVDEHTVYEIGSISKVFTCIVLADEVLKGKMKLDDPISKYLPSSISVPTRNDKVITLRDLATHTSALPRMPNNFEPEDIKNPFADYSVKQLYEFLSDYDLPRDIGSKYEYSNVGMGLLGHILELHTGKPYEALIKERITEPLGMLDTGITLTPNMKSNLALGYDAQMKLTKNWDIPTLAGAGALRSTTSDIIKFIKANVTDDGSDLYLAMNLSHQEAYSNDAKGFKIGLGWHYANNNAIVWHNGGTGGYKTFTGFLRGTKKGVAVFTNSTSSADAVGLKQLGQVLDLKMPTKIEYPDIIEVSDEILELYTGKYQLTPEFFITITKRNSMLIAQATGQQEFELFASAQNEFFLKVVEASVSFNKNEEGLVKGLILHQGGQDIPGTKVE
jgi:D-alanyl-D-alanine-carboxypeptidase/D-alanyl-D-alanine-endopeptidase